jgi:hypothetical protein
MWEILASNPAPFNDYSDNILWISSETLQANIETMSEIGAPGSLLGRGTKLQATRRLVRFRKSFNFSIEFTSQAVLGPWGRFTRRL